MALLTLGLGGLATNTEIILNFYLLLLLYLLVTFSGSKSAFVFGLVGAIAVNTNYICIPICGVLGLYFCYRHFREPIRIVWASAGVVVGVVADPVADLPVLGYWRIFPINWVFSTAIGIRWALALRRGLSRGASQMIAAAAKKTSAETRKR